MKEVAALYQVSLVTIHKWRKHKILPPTIKKGGRVFFRRDEIFKSLEK
ncbi:MAG: helix-turn-helix domain-containing protein [Bacteroidetes bacterium]|nr:helix-turn-helix domain-containing protein [Bacteroidota bacterium]